MYHIRDMNDTDLIVMLYKDEYMLQNLVLKYPEITSIIRTHKIPHYFLVFANTNYLILIIDEEYTPFSVLCGLDMSKVKNIDKYKNISPQYINCLFEK